MKNNLTPTLIAKNLIVLWIVAFANLAAAKCADVDQRVGGVVVDSAGAPIEGTSIAMAWRADRYSAPRTEKTKTSADGRFVVTLPFNPLSGSAPNGFDLCDAKPGEVTITVSKLGFETLTHIVKLGDKPSNMRLSLK